MMSFPRVMTLWLIVAVAALALAVPAQAQSLDSIEIHGFGGWAYGKTDGLKYLIGTEDGQYDNAEFALNIAAKPIDRLSIVAQVRFESGADDQEADLDYAFAEYSFSDAVRVRMGRVKHPFGIYGEVFDVGTIRPFYYLPQGVYGPSGFTARAYNGLGLTGNIRLGSSKWMAQYDVYGGQMEGDFDVPGLLTGLPGNASLPKVSYDYSTDDAIGGRIVFLTPVDGLSFGGSVFTGDTTLATTSDSSGTTVWSVQAEYSGEKLAIRGEYADYDGGSHFAEKAAYVEASYRINQRWQLATRWDDLDVHIGGLDRIAPFLPAFFPQLLTSTDLGFAVNYWFSPGFVVRGEVHKVEGNRFAYPATGDDVFAAIMTGDMDDETTMFVLGAQFSF